MKRKSSPPPSLSQHFDAPTDYVGEMGWIVGFSADASFLNNAAERFCRKTKAQLSWEGVPRLGLMLDPGQIQLSPVDVPGVAHLPLSARRKPFRLLHAKVAILGFRHERRPNDWRLRLVVSTGNWTRQTLEESLDLCWVVDVASTEVGNESSALSCADVRAAWDFISFVRGFYDDRIFDEGATSLASWVDQIEPASRLPLPRFIDNRQRSFLAQLPGVIKHHAGTAARNHLSMGAGFYEAPAGPGVPKVLEEITSELRLASLLTANPEVAIFVNPNSCQAIAGAAGSILKKRWDIRLPGQLPNHRADAPPRTLHAKFLFGANYRSTSNNCTSSWVYLGSGNLTKPGFTSAMSTGGGNLEAGVVFAPQGLFWYPEKVDDPTSVISYRLPVQWKTTIQDIAILTAGQDMPELNDDFVAAPVAWLQWKTNPQGGGWLEVPDGTERIDFDIFYGDEQCLRQSERFSWQSEQPRQVDVRWDEGGVSRQAFVAVRDEYGRFASGKLPDLNHADAWLQLASFPMPPEEEEAGAVETDGMPDGMLTGSWSERPEASYPIREMMSLLEKIAEKQTSVAEVDWLTWITRLEQTLVQMADCSVLTAFKALGINPLSVLIRPEFRPNYAEDNSTDGGSRYESALKRVVENWGVGAMEDLGTL